VFRRVLRMLALVVTCLFPLTALGAPPVEVITLEEEATPNPTGPSSTPGQPDSAPKKKKKKKKKRRASESKKVEEADEDEEAAAEPPPEEDEEADEEAAPKKKKKKKADDEAEAKKKEEEEPEEPQAPVECMPELTEVETRRPIPLACTIASKSVTAMELRYRPPGDQWKTLAMKKEGEEWIAEIPCSATVKAGTFEFSINARTKKGKTAGKLDPVTVKLMESTSEPPPSIPGQEPPARCFDPSECPGDMLGSPACPGTKKGVGMRSWGASCADSKECTKGLACVAGTCESPPKCESDAECQSGICSNGQCAFPDAEEMASQLGPPRLNWLGVEVGVDIALGGEAVGVCGNESDDAEKYTCFEGGDEYDGLPNVNNAGKVDGSIGPATVRAMLSYNRAFGRILAGARLGWAFRGAPEGFLPLHLEGRVAYALRSDPLKRKLRPYLGLAFGLAQVDTQAKVTIIDCGDNGSCAQAPQITQGQIDAGLATVKELTAYRSGSKFFAGPTFTVMYAFTNESGIVGTLNVMLPDLSISPSLGYVQGL
jgi:hypothetical protein